MVNFRFGKTRQLLRFVSLILIQIFILSQSTFNYAAVPDKLQFNEKYGRIRESFKGKSDKMIIHIQDAHCIYEAQKNIVGLIRDLYKNHNVKLVTVEGADAYFNADSLSAFPIQSVKQDVAEYFLNKGRISGVEYLLIQNDLPIAVRGAENRDLYVDNYNSFLKSLAKPDDKAIALIDDLDIAFTMLKDKMLSKELKDLDAKDRLQASGETQFIDYALGMIKTANDNNISVENYKNVKTLISAQEIEKQIDFAKINVELSNLIDSISEKISKDDLTQLLNKNLSYKIGKLQPYDFFDYLKNLSKENSFDTESYSNLMKYADYLNLYQSIDDVEIAKEISSLKSELKDKLYTNSDQKELIKLSSDLMVLKKLISLKVSKTEFRYYQANKSDFAETRFIVFLTRHLPVYQIPFNFDKDYSIISQRLPLIDEFYKVAVKRNEALIENTVSEMELEDSNIAILITGGFHTQGITELLKDQGISYKVISPSITEQPSSTPYLTRMVGNPTDVEEMLSSNRLQIPLVLADPAIIPDAAKSEAFVGSFKALLETHPDAVELQKILAEAPTGYTPALTFVDSFTIGDNKYLSFSLAGKKFNMAFVPGDAKQIQGSINGQVSKIGNYTFAFLNDETFTNLVLQNRAQGGNIDTRTGIDSRLEHALIQGSVVTFETVDQPVVDQMTANNFLVKQTDGTYKPTFGYMLNSKVTALVVQPKVAQVSGLDAGIENIFKNNGINRVEIYSNQVGITPQEALELNQKLEDLLKNNKIELSTGKKVFSTVIDGVAQIYSITPQGNLKLKPQLVISDAVFNAMLPEAPQVKVATASQSDRQGFIDLNVTDRMSITLTLYELDDKGERKTVDNPIFLSPNVTSAEILQGILNLRRLAATNNIGLIGYGNPQAGIGISFDNLPALLDSVMNTDAGKALSNVFKLISVAPSFKDIDLTGIENAQQLKDYFLGFTDKSYDAKITCAAAAGAVMHDKVNVADKAFDVTLHDRAQLFAQMLPLIDQRMRGVISTNKFNEPQYSIYAIAQAYQFFGQNTQALSVPVENLPQLLDSLANGESVVIRVEIEPGVGHAVAFKKDVDGFFVNDMESGPDFTALSNDLPKIGLQTIIDNYSGKFTGQAVVGQRFDQTTANIKKLIDDKKVAILDIDKQLADDALMACGTMMMFPIQIEAGSIEPIRKALKSLARIDYRGSDSHSLQVTYTKVEQEPGTTKAVENSYVRTFKVAYSSVPPKVGLEILVKEVVNDKDVFYMRLAPDGTIERVAAPSFDQLRKERKTLPQWERDFATKFANDQVADQFGMGLPTDSGLYGPQIHGLTATNIKSYMPTLIERIVTTFNSDFDANSTIRNVTGQVRWATHGESNVIGAHPHTAGPNEVRFPTNVGTVSVVHNGVFYGYQEHRNTLEGHRFKTDVDTEVLAHLIFQEIHDNKPGTLKQAVQTVLEKLEFDSEPPTYSLQITSTDYPNEVVTAKRVSPIYLAISDEVSEDQPFVYFASDPKATIPHTKYYSDLIDDGVVFSSSKEGMTGTRFQKKDKTIVEQPVVIVLPDGTFTDGKFVAPGQVEFQRINVRIVNKETKEEKVVSSLDDIRPGLTGNDLVNMVKPKSKYQDGKFAIKTESGDIAAFTHMRVGKDRPEIYDRGEYETYTEKELAQISDAIIKTIDGNTQRIPVMYIPEGYNNAYRLSNLVDGMEGAKGELSVMLNAQEREEIDAGKTIVKDINGKPMGFARAVAGVTYDLVPTQYFFDANSGKILSLGSMVDGYAGNKSELGPEYHKLTDKEILDILRGKTIEKQIDGRMINVSKIPSNEEMVKLTAGKLDSLLRVDFKTEKADKWIPSLNISIDDLKNVDRIWLFSTGSSFNADLAAQQLFRLPGVTTDIIDNDTFRDAPNLDSRVGSSQKILAVFTSQSGTTQVAVMNAELLNKYAKDPQSLGYQKITLLADTNTPGSMITEKTDGQINEHAGPEIAVASQKAVHAQLTNKFLLSELLKRAKGISDPVTESMGLQGRLNVAKALGDLLDLENMEIDNQINDWSQRFARIRAMFIIYRGEEEAEGAAKETVLKFQELARVFSTPLQAGLFLHGPVALVEKVQKTREAKYDPQAIYDPRSGKIVSNPGITDVPTKEGKDLLNTPILAFYMPKADGAEEQGARARFESNLQSIKARGANVFVITTKEYGEALVNGNYVEEYLPINSIHDAIAVGQRLAVRIAKAKVVNVADPLQAYIRDIRALMVNIDDPSKLNERRNNIDKLGNKLLDLVKEMEVLSASGTLNDLVQPQFTFVVRSFIDKLYKTIYETLNVGVSDLNAQVELIQLEGQELINKLDQLVRAIDVDKPKDLAKSVTVENRYSNFSLNEIRKSLDLINLEQDDIRDLTRQGAFELDVNGKINAVPERLLALIAAIQKTDLASVVNEGMYHELVEKTLRDYTGLDVVAEVESRLESTLSPQDLNNLQMAFVKDYSGDSGFQNFNDMVRELIAKTFTQKVVPDPTSKFFADPQNIAITNKIEQIVKAIAPMVFDVINPSPVSVKDNIDRLVDGMKAKLSIPVSDDFTKAIVDQKQQAFINNILTVELLSAIKLLNQREGVEVTKAIEEAKAISDRVKADVESARERMNQDLSLMPNVTAMNVSFFETEDGMTDSKTIGMAQKIKEFAADPKNVFVVYSLTKNSNEIIQALATKGITDKEVIVIGQDTLKAFLGENFALENPEMNIISLPAYVQKQLNIEGIRLEMKDFTIIENDKKVADLALDNLASVLDVPQGFLPENLQNGQEIELGISAFELANMLEAGEDLPGDLIITQVSAQNKFVAQAIESIKAEKGADAEISLDDLRSYLGLERLNKEDLRGIRLKRKLKITDSFIKNLKAQRALDISA